MLTTQDFALKTETGADLAVTSTTAGLSSVDVAGGRAQNNYARPAGQNVRAPGWCVAVGWLRVAPHARRSKKLIL